MFQFELHPHIGEICKQIGVHNKGGLIARVKAGLSDLEFVTITNSVKYFVENWKDGCVSVFMFAPRIGISL